MFQIYVQGDSQFRLRPEDLQNINVRNKDGNMIPLGTLVKITPTVGPSLISLFNLYPSATIIGLPADGFSSGEVLKLMEEIARRTLPPGTGFEWSAMSYQEKIVGYQMYIVFGLALLLVYLVLAGQYESWYAPISVDPGGAAVVHRAGGGALGARRAAGSTTISTSRSGSCC